MSNLEDVFEEEQVKKVKDTISEVVDEYNTDPDELPERTKNGREPCVEVEQVTTTDDRHNDPCLRVDKGKSHMMLVHAINEDILYIHDVVSKYKGDFSDMMDKLVKETGTNHIKFTMLVNDNLENVLNGFEKKTEFYGNLGYEDEVLEGEWKLNN